MKKEIIKFLQEEIKWARKHEQPRPLTKEWKIGFIDGINQAINITRKVKNFE